MNEFQFTKAMDYIDKQAIDNAIISAWAIYTVYNQENDITIFQEYIYQVINNYYYPTTAGVGVSVKVPE